LKVITYHPDPHTTDYSFNRAVSLKWPVKTVRQTLLKHSLTHYRHRQYQVIGYIVTMVMSWTHWLPNLW